MNQILSTNIEVHKKGNNQGDIKKVIKVFAIILIIFAFGAIGIGTYSLLGGGNGKNNTAAQPTFSLEYKTETTLLLKVMHNNNIQEVSYNWNTEEPVIIDGKQRKYVEQEIVIPAGTNELHINVIDEYGQASDYDKTYELESNIKFDVIGNKIKITYQGETNIKYMTYRWDEEDEKTIEINNRNIDYEIDAMKGLHTLTVVVVDENNKTDTNTQKINGVARPELTIDANEEQTQFVISTSDEKGIEKIEIILNEDKENTYLVNLSEYDLKEFNYTLPINLPEGENIIEVTVYNKEGITTIQKGRLLKQ